MTLLRPLPPAVTRPLSLVVVFVWVVTMGVLVERSYLQASPASLATDLARYGTSATWRGIYYRGEKIGFTVSQTVPDGDGFELQEDGRLQMLLLGAASAATLHTSVHVDAGFALRRFDFSLDPGTGAVRVTGRIEEPTVGGGRSRLLLTVTTTGGSHTESRELEERPALSLNLSRLLASGRLRSGTTLRIPVFDPATLRNTEAQISIGEREIVRAADRPVPAFRVAMDIQGLKTTSWVTDTGEVVREESPLGLMTVQESAARAQQLAVSSRIQSDLQNAAAVVPGGSVRIDDPRDVRRLLLRVEGVDLSGYDLQGVGQTFDGSRLTIVDPRTLRPLPADPEAVDFTAAEPLIESDAPEIVAEAARAVQGVPDSASARAERLTRYVNALLEKKPTVSLPSAREVLRTRVGDCNEHTALYVAMARASGIPARVAVGLVLVHGAFYYHAWPEVYLTERDGRGYWLPVDPTLNQYPADATHLRLARGGLDRQAAILPLISRLKLTVEQVDLAPTAAPTLVGRPPTDLGPLPNAPAPAAAGSCRCDKAGSR